MPRPLAYKKDAIFKGSYAPFMMIGYKYPFHLSEYSQIRKSETEITFPGQQKVPSRPSNHQNGNFKDNMVKVVHFL